MADDELDRETGDMPGGEDDPTVVRRRWLTRRNVFLSIGVVAVGVLLTGLLMIAMYRAGFADTHSAAVSVAALVEEKRIAAPLSVIPILAAITTNTISKMIFAVSAGGRSFALYVIPGLILLVAAAWAGAFVAGPVRF